MVLDTNVVISALLWHGTPRALFDAARDGRVQLFTSAPLLEELTDVLERRRFETKIASSGLTVDALVDRYGLEARLVRPRAVTVVRLDPDDDVVVGTALAAGAELIVSGDSHLLGLKSHRNIAIVTAASALRKLG